MTDVIIIGAGAAGMTAALAASAAGARVILVEKTDKIGGTAAVSGGIVWAPMNHHIAPDDPDDRAAALAYFGALAPALEHSDVLAAFIDQAGAAVRFLEDATRVRFAPLPGYPDYYLDRPGARPQGGRALDSGLFAYADLGEWAERILVADPLPMTVAETPLGGAASLPAPDVIAGRIARKERGFGQALVGALLEACLASGIDIRLETRVVELVKENGRIGGALLPTAPSLARRAALFSRPAGSSGMPTSRAPSCAGRSPIPLHRPAIPAMVLHWRWHRARRSPT